jgi:predicted transcriptional regulator
MPTKRKTVSVRLEPKLARRLAKLAKESERSMSWHINRLVEDNIDDLEKQLTRILRGLEQARRGEGEDAEVVFKRLFEELEHRKAAHARKAV